MAISEPDNSRETDIFIPGQGEAGLIRPRLASELIVPPAPRLPTHYFVPSHHQQNLARIDKNNWYPGLDGAPLCIFNTGWTDDGERAAEVVIDRPEEYRLRRPKETIEEHHLMRFVADWRREHREDPFRYARGADPPDFELNLGDHRAGLDVTQLLLQDLVARQAAFRHIKTAILLEGPASFRHLQGLIVYLTLEVDAERRMRHVAPACVQALRSLSPNRSLDPDDPGAGQGLVEFEHGVATTGWLLKPSSGAFFGLMRFELALVGGPLVKQQEAWEMLERLIAQHDKPGVDNLLMPVMAPAADGYVYSSGGAVFSLLYEKFQNEEAVFEAQHVNAVFMHLWPHRAIVALFQGHPHFRAMTRLEPIEDLTSPLLRNFRFVSPDPDQTSSEG